MSTEPETGWGDDRLRAIVEHISDAALELAFVRHDLESDEFDETEYPDVGGMRQREQAREQWWETIKEDVLNCLTGDDFGCLDPEELDETNCELLWLKRQLTATPADTEQLVRLRASAERAIEVIPYNDRELAEAKTIIGNIYFYAVEDNAVSVEAFQNLSERIAEALATRRDENEKLGGFVSMIARMTRDGEGGYEPDPINALETLGSLITKAREIGGSK